MQKIILLATVLFTSLTLFAQQQGNGNRSGMTGRMYGRIVEGSSNKGIDAASVQLITMRMDTVTKQRTEVIVNGMLTMANGDFSLESVPVMGRYTLRISAIGFKQIDQPVSFMGEGGARPADMMSALDKDLGNIKLSIDEKLLAGVTVTAERPLLSLGIDRKVFNVDKNLVSAGGTGVDVMKNVPSVNVDIDGNVTLRNNAPQIFVDGRPTNLTLEQIPADAIESVEIITNPSAKFDASGGTAGILNIVLKKNRKVGYNGSIRANIDSRAKVGLGGDINLRQNKVNMFVAGNFNQRKSISTGKTERLTLIDTPNTFLSQFDRSEMNGNFGFGRAGIDYFISNRNTLSLSGNMGRGKMNPENESDIYIDTLFNPVRSSFTDRTSRSSNEFRNMGTMLSFKHLFPKAGNELTADVTYNKGKNENSTRTNATYYKGSQIDRTFAQRQDGKGENSNVVFQADYANPISQNSKFEIGARTNIRKVVSENLFYLISELGQETYSPELSVRYNSKDQVYAAYSTFSNRIKNFGYQLGLRIESSQYVGTLLGITPDKDQDFEIDFPISFFPSAFLTQKINDNNELQLNYSRRINRPNFWQLMPFTDYSDSLNLSRGNPGLNPEFTNSLELSYMKIFKNRDNFLASVYFKHTDNLITRYQTREVNPLSGKNVLVNSFINANSSYVTGLELVSRNKLAKWWDLNTNFNLFTSKIDITDPLQPEQDQFASWFFKINNSFRFPNNLSFQLSGDYQSKTVLPPGGSGGGGGGRGGPGGGGFGGFGGGSSSQGYNKPNYGVDFGVRYEFLKDRTASLSLNVNDVFKTKQFRSHSESPFFIQDVSRRRDAQVVRLNFNWRFGKFDASLFKRRNNREQGDSGMDQMQ